MTRSPAWRRTTIAPSRKSKKRSGTKRREPPLVFFIDASMGRAVGRRLSDEGIRMELHDDHFTQGTPDAEWLRVVGQRRWIVVTKDTRIRYRPNEKQALLAAGVRAFAFASGNLSGAEMSAAIVKALPKMMKLLATHRRAFLARITAASDVTILLEE